MTSFAQEYIFDPEAREIWSDSATLQRWLDVEVALAHAQADVGLIPASAAKRIGECGRVELFDLARLSKAIAFAQHPLMPVLKHLVQLCGQPEGGWVHWGATTQNILDTAQSLQLDATASLICRKVQVTISVLKTAAGTYADTIQAGRTHGQHALPITFGFKLACWAAELQRHLVRLERIRKSNFVVRMGGAVGTYAAMNGKGRLVEERVAHALGLPQAEIGGRADGDRQAEYVAMIGMLASTCEKVAADLLFLQRSEVAEIAERHYVGRTGSSTMAQKRNPTEAQRVMMLARLARSRTSLAFDSMVRSDEGDAVAAHLMDYILPETSLFGASALSALNALLEGMQVDPKRMLDNLNAGGGLIMAESVMMRIAQFIGRDHAHALVHAAATQCAETGTAFPATLRCHAQTAGIDPALITEELFDARCYLGETPALIDRIVAMPR